MSMRSDRSVSSVASRLRRNRAAYRAMFDALEDRTLLSVSPVGKVEVMTAAQVSGYVFDTADPSTPIQVEVMVDGQLAAQGDANIDRPDISSKTQGTGTTHGFSFPLTLASGNHSVQVIAINPDGSGAQTTLRKATVVNHKPVGSISSFSNTQVVGFAMDPDLPNSGSQVEIMVDGTLAATVTADQAKPQGAKGAGAGDHWFVANLTGITGGAHQIQMLVQDSPSGNFVLVATKVTANQKPRGKLEVANQNTISGYAWDPDSSGPVEIFLQLGKPPTVDEGPANIARPDVAVLPDPDHGFSITPTPTTLFGTVQVKVFAKDTTTGALTLIGTKTYKQNPPKGGVEIFTATELKGFVFDPDEPSTPVDILIRVGGPSGQIVTVTANVSRPDLVTKHKLPTPDHGFDVNMGAVFTSLSTPAGPTLVEVFAKDPVTGVTILLSKKTLVAT